MSSLQVEAPQKELAQTQTVTAAKKKTNELFAKNNGKMGCEDDDSNLPEAYVRCVTTAKRKLGFLQVDAEDKQDVAPKAVSQAVSRDLATAVRQMGRPRIHVEHRQRGPQDEPTAHGQVTAAAASGEGSQTKTP